MHEKRSSHRLKGFTMVELLFAMFIFSILMVSAAGIFGQAFGSYRNAKFIQQDVENAQFLLDQMAKELRTSTIVTPVTPGGFTSSIQYYDYSQATCYRYSISGGNVYKAAYVPGRATSEQDVAACRSTTLSSFAPISSGTVTGTFYLVSSDDSPQRIGRVTIGLRIARNSAHVATIQSSVALRDFGYVGLVN